MKMYPAARGWTLDRAFTLHA